MSVDYTAIYGYGFMITADFLFHSISPLLSTIVSFLLRLMQFYMS